MLALEIDYRLVLDAFADAVVAADRTGRIVYVNAAVEKLLGWRKDELIGRPLTVLVPDRLLPAHQAGFARYVATGETRLIGRTIRVPARRRDGTEVEIDLALGRLPGAKDELLIASLRDVSDRVELERQLALADRLRAATRAALKLTAKLDPQNVVDTAVETLTRDFDAVLARLWLHEPEKGTLVLAGSAGIAAEAGTSVGSRIDVATHPYKVGVVARMRTPFVKNGLGGDPELEQDWIARERIASVAAFPLLVGGELRGVLESYFRRPLRDEVPDVLGTFAAMVATAVNDTLLFRREQSARRELEAATRALEARESELQVIIDALPALVAYIDRDIRYRRTNLAYEAWFGRSRAEVQGMRVRDLVGEEAYTAILPRMEAALRGEFVSYEAELSYPGKVKRWVEATYTPQRGPDGTVEGFIALVHDVTGRKRGEEERTDLLHREQAARTEAVTLAERSMFLAEASKVLASSLDYEATLAGVAKLAVPRLADWCMIDVVREDGSIHRLAITHRDPAKVELARELSRRYPSRPDTPVGAARVLRTGRSELCAEVDDTLLAAVARDPEHLEILRSVGFKSYFAVPLRAREKLLGALTFVSAESGRRYGEGDLDMAEELGSRVALAVDNARLYSESQEAIRLRDEFMSVASHELRTPLTPLQLQLQSLKRALRSSDASAPLGDVSAKLDMADRQVVRLGRLVTDLLDVSRARADRLTLDLEDVDLRAVTADVVERAREQIEAAGSTIAFDGAAPVVGRWDKLRLDRVVTNLISNAAKYGARKPIEVTLSADDETARLAVRDHGIGISEVDQARIFQRFARAVSERYYGGLGLGLWITKEIVEAMSGTITVASELGAGSTFTVTLPRHEAREEERRRSAS